MYNVCIKNIDFMYYKKKIKIDKSTKCKLSYIYGYGRMKAIYIFIL